MLLADQMSILPVLKLLIIDDAPIVQLMKRSPTKPFLSLPNNGCKFARALLIAFALHGVSKKLMDHQLICETVFAQREIGVQYAKKVYLISALLSYSTLLNYKSYIKSIVEMLVVIVNP